MREKQILTFEEAWRLEVFAAVLGVEEVGKFLQIRYPPGMQCGFSEDEILYFGDQARRDFETPRDKKPPIAMILIPSKILGVRDEKIEYSLCQLLKFFNVKLVFEEDALLKGKERQDSFSLQTKLSKLVETLTFRHLVVMTYLLPNPVYLTKTASAQKRLALERRETILTFSEAVFCQLMMRAAMNNVADYKTGEEIPSLLPRLTDTSFCLTLPDAEDYSNILVVFYFDPACKNFYYRLVKEDEQMIICSGRAVHLW